MTNTLRAIVVGCGNMGASHARAFAQLAQFELVGLVARGPERRAPLAAELGGVPQFDSLAEALAATRPDVAAICTYADTHAAFAIQCLEAGAHVFVEKPIAQSVAEARTVLDAARRLRRKVVVGYILRHHPAWIRFIELARTLGKPLVMRMNLNQQSSGDMWRQHRSLMQTMSPIVDCGVHYVDVMCQMTGSRPTQVSAIGARLSDEIAPDMYNYGQLQVRFEDDSVGWYEAGWGPMISEEAFFVKDVIGPRGSVSIAKPSAGSGGESADIAAHAQTKSLRLHHGELDAQGRLVRADEWIDTADEPDHQGLCDREQAWFARAIREDLDLTAHWDDAINSLRIVLAADQSVREGRTIALGEA